MICTRCGNTVPDGTLTCENCGTYLGKYATAMPESGPQSIRQGRTDAAQASTLPPRRSRVQEYGDYECSSIPLPRDNPSRNQKPSSASRPDMHRGATKIDASLAFSHKRKPHRPGDRLPRAVNWLKIGCIVGLLLLIGGMALYSSIQKSEGGQRSIARSNTLTANETLFALAVNTRDPLVQEEREELLKQWNEASPQAYWQCAQEYLDMGDVETAITCLRIGDVLEPKNYDGLLLLANAYELNAQDVYAEEIYLYLTTEVSPARTEAYTALIRMYQSQSRRPEAADMMKIAYQNTDRENYRLEREDYIPETPQISLRAGRYEINKLEGNVMLTSSQGYDIYYTTDDAAELPEGGMLSTNGSFVPQEGTVTLRAVCVSGDLVSDPISVTYTFYYPSPPAPKSNLAPNTYKSRREVSLRPGELGDDKIKQKEREEIESHYRYYYTIDGSTPTVDSPVYDGTPIKMPTGRVTLKAVCVNQYDKMSSILEVGYKFDLKPYPLEVYQETDVFAGFVLNKTTIEEFRSAFGQPNEELDTNYITAGIAKHLNYDWGYAVFLLKGSTWELVRIDMNKSLGGGPRGVGFGSTEDEITAVYKDFGQVQSPNGDRGLYYDYPRVGKAYTDENGTRVIQYTCSTAASEMWVLRYYLGSNGRVNRILHYYQP